MTIEERRALYDKFLGKWPTETVEAMTLLDYVAVNNPDTFCRWVEHQTTDLGSIRGSSSLKFGIYRRKDGKERLRAHENDNEYTWLSKFGETRNEAFSKIRNEILDTIKCAETDNVEAIDDIPLSNMFKWKIAFLYSNERLIPIYEPETLKRVAKHYGLAETNPKVSKIQRLMIDRKPAHMDVYEYMGWLWDNFSKPARKDDSSSMGEAIRSPNPPKKATKLTRVGTNQLNTDSQVRAAVRSYVVEQKHKKLQLALKERLVTQYDENCVVVFEENNVDVKLIQADCITFYEVKSSPYAETCVREAIGQLIHYSFFDDNPMKKKLVVVGQYPPTSNEIAFIDYIEKEFNISYQSIELN